MNNKYMYNLDLFTDAININKTIIVVEDDERFIEQLIDLEFDILLMRYGYDLPPFSKEYFERTKSLPIFNYIHNNLLSRSEYDRLVDYFLYHQKKPFIAYLPEDGKYFKLKNFLLMLGAVVVSDRNVLLSFMKQKKLIFINSEGALKKSDNEITEYTKKMIEENKKIGNRIIISTSKSRYQALEDMKKSGANDIIICSNGSEIYDAKNDKIIFNSFIDNEEIYKLVDYAFSNDIRMILTSDNYEYVTKEIRTSKQKLLNKDTYKNELNNCNIKQCMCTHKKYRILSKIKKIVSSNAKLNIVDEETRYSEKWFVFMNTDCSKGNALKILAKYLEIPISSTIAIGSDKNDLSMLKEAGLSVAVQNAPLNVKNDVNYIASSNDKNGVALFLKKFL